MAKANLQTVIVSKDRAATRAGATKVARAHANRIYTSRETDTSWRFRQRPPTDFVKGSFRTFTIPGEAGVSLVYGELKAEENPVTKPLLRRWRRYTDRADEASNLKDLAKLAERGRVLFDDERMLYVFESAVAKRATKLGMQCNLKRAESVKRCVDDLVEGRWQVSMFDNPSKRRVLKSPRVMPDPGPSAWLGGLLEWSWVAKGGEEFLWEPNGEWIFLWSPELKAVVGIPSPTKKVRLDKVSRRGGGAKMFERFTARDAENTHEIDMKDTKLKKLGAAKHIVYRSDKWKPGEDTDYIHEFGKGVQLYVGPSIGKPKVFLCFGGKLTATERGLVY